MGPLDARTSLSEGEQLAHALHHGVGHSRANISTQKKNNLVDENNEKKKTTSHESGCTTSTEALEILEV